MRALFSKFHNINGRLYNPGDYGELSLTEVQTAVNIDGITLLPNGKIPSELIYSVILTSQGGGNPPLIDRIDYDRWDMIPTAVITNEPVPDGAYSIHVAANKCLEFQNHYPALSGRWALPAITGRFTGSLGSTTLSGSGTRFLSELTVGQYLYNGSAYYKIINITSDTLLTISSPLKSSISAGLFYRSNASHRTFGLDSVSNYFTYCDASVYENPDPTTINTTKIIASALWAQNGELGHWNSASSIQSYDSTTNTEAWLEAGVKISVKLYTCGIYTI